MKRFATVVFFYLLHGCLSAQLIPLNNEYLINPVLINPAAAGLDGSASFSFSIRKQWDGLKDAPEFQCLGMDTRIKKIGKYNHSGEKKKNYFFPSSGKAGLFFNITRDINAPFTRSGLQLGYAYHSLLSKGKSGILSVGLGIQLYQQKLDLTNLQEYKDTDPAILNYENGFIPNVSAGLVYQYKKFIFQTSGLFIIPSKLNQSSGNYTEYSKSQWFIAASYRFNLNRSLHYTPQLVFKSIPGRIEFNQQFDIANHLVVNLTWNTDEQVGVIAGARISNYQVGYAFDYHYGLVRNYVEGSHTIYFIFNLPPNKTRNK